jgi:hypothetical protein
MHFVIAEIFAGTGIQIGHEGRGVAQHCIASALEKPIPTRAIGEALEGFRCCSVAL